MEKYGKLALLLAISVIFVVSCKKQPEKEVEKKNEINITQKEIKVEENKPDDKEKDKENENKEALKIIDGFKGKIYSNGKETITILSEEDLADGSIANHLGVEVKAGDIHVFKIGDAESGEVFSDVKVEKIDGNNVITAKGLNKKLLIIDENTLKDTITGIEYKKM